MEAKIDNIDFTKCCRIAYTKLDTTINETLHLVHINGVVSYQLIFPIKNLLMDFLEIWGCSMLEALSSHLLMGHTQNHTEIYKTKVYHRT